MTTLNPKIDFTSLGIIFMYALVIVALVYTHTWEFHTSDESLTWQQPEQPNPKPFIAPANHDLVFVSIEKELGNILYTSDGNMILNANTATTLQRTLNSFPKDINDKSMERLRFLTNQVHPFDGKNQLETLIFNYQKYLQANEDITPKRELTLTESEALLHKKIKLKQSIFGKKDAKKLFGSRHALAFYIINLRKVIRNEGLTPIEKQHKINELGKELKSQKSIL